MATEPSEEDINNFIGFTSLSREQAISFLNANNLNLEKAINAYFENPSGLPTQPQNEWESFGTPSYSQNNQSVPTFNIENSDGILGKGYTAPPSRPPSRINTSETLGNQKHNGIGAGTSGAGQSGNSGQKLSAAQLEERDLQQAVAMSLGQDYTHQESGVISTTDNSRFGPATQDFYDENSWGMTIFNENAREEIISPDPEDRQRNGNEPAFLRPSQEALYIGGFLTILHSIPIAREALLLRDKVIPDYGYDSQWWNGQPVKAPRIVSLSDPYAEDQDWEDIIYETQRLMAFLDVTRRAFGSTDALASLKAMHGYDQDGGVEKFLEAWQEAAVRATPENQLSMIFSSRAMRKTESDFDPLNNKEFFVLNTQVEPDHGQTLYDILDDAIWPDTPGEGLDDVWLEHVAEVLTIRLDNSRNEPIDVKIPSTFYPDRYMETSRDIIREIRLKRVEVLAKINHLESLASQYRSSESAKRFGMSNEKLLEKAAEASVVALPRYLSEGAAELNSEELLNNGQRVAQQLRDVATSIRERLQKLETEKQEARDSLRKYSKIFTEPSASDDQSPHRKYTLRGVCTAPHVTFVLRRNSHDGSEDLIEMEDTNAEEWQWWRISFSADDAKTQQAAKSENTKRRNLAPKNADIVGFTTTKVREIEVLKAARESSNALLVYANPNALAFQTDHTPPPLQEFVNTDNISFKAELDAADRMYQDEQMVEPGETVFEEWPDINETQAPTRPDNIAAAASNVNVFDYEVNSFDDEASNRGQEMQEVGGKSLLTGRDRIKLCLSYHHLCFTLRIYYRALMSLETAAIASASVELLEGRLRRLEYLLTGDSQWTGHPAPASRPDSLEDTVARRLARLEADLSALSKSKPAVYDILQLYTRFPDLFKEMPTEAPPANLSTQNLASIVLSYASAFPETSSRLTSLNDLPVPDAKASIALIELQPRLERLLQIQRQQAQEVSELRTRSARLLQRWYELGLVGSSECWADWESRLEDIDHEVKRREAVRDRREKEV
ncbi:hypothetical protein BGW36DRAFT_289204 [Talaromyces proteolyticus]|uniref:Ubiquitin interaction motif protein n=1 Tax=Talaromyces proteolyticus TaxID=1131652 RepID=A0AAD4KV51_9EURO|nr:uncharacterized protein BGW36DRAFT_289204 [Talaromyces proteolyticus]KAH8701803.1 hypothetical protein BGW36DRAFT_289204 [Talaromyces proteolyticus]